jgi:hypothetical protein
MLARALTCILVRLLRGIHRATPGLQLGVRSTALRVAEVLSVCRCLGSASRRQGELVSRAGLTRIAAPENENLAVSGARTHGAAVGTW